MFKIYFPMTVNILTKGHIDCLKYLSNKGIVIVGLLTTKGLKGYKEELMSFKERRYILESLNIKRFLVIPQDSLDPSQNIKNFKCNAIASGDGWEKEELKVIKDMNLTQIDIKLDNEVVGKKYSSTSIINKIKKSKHK
jgi:glycerol-3-phosphate cytidylyltransferase-like family protein